MVQKKGESSKVVRKNENYRMFEKRIIIENSRTRLAAVGLAHCTVKKLKNEKLKIVIVIFRNIRKDWDFLWKKYFYLAKKLNKKCI